MTTKAFSSAAILALSFASGLIASPAVAEDAKLNPEVGERELVDRVAAVIENEIITLRELEAKAAPYLEKLGEIEDPRERQKERREILKRVLDIEIDERVVNEEIERSQERLGVTDKDVDRAIEEVMRMNNMTEDQLQAALYTQGVTWSEYRKRLRSQIERARLIQFRVQGKVQVSDTEARRRCERRQKDGAREVQVCASHILRRIPEGASEEEIQKLRARMAEIQAELAAGADFSAYALKYSDDKGAPDGDLGCFGRGEMVDAFEKAAFALQVGEVSPVVRSPFGFHIIKVRERRAARSEACSGEALETFKQEIYQEKVDQQMQVWLRELRSKTFIDIRI